MRRAAVCSLDLNEVDFDKHTVNVREKGGQSHRYKISKEGAKAIKTISARSGGSTRRCSLTLRRSSCRWRPLPTVPAA
jgi:integrase